MTAATATRRRHKVDRIYIARIKAAGDAVFASRREVIHAGRAAEAEAHAELLPLIEAIDAEWAALRERMILARRERDARRAAAKGAAA
jgi:hypothetical protein